MFDVLDMIVAPLTELNPIRYCTNVAYRAAKQRELGRRARRILIYQVALVSVLALLVVIATASAAAASDLQKGIDQIEALENVIDDEVDLLSAKLVIDRLIDPRVDEAKVRAQIDAIQSSWINRIPADASNDQQMQLLMETIYTAGPWNDERPFGYDFDDPYGANLQNKTLSAYLESRRGNCVTMPTLLVLLGQRRGLPITLASAPTHVFAKYRRDSGEWMNVEATSGGFRYDASYVRDFEITPLAIERGTYLRPLSRKESVALLSGDLRGHLRDSGDLVGMQRLLEATSPLHLRSVHNVLGWHSLHANWMNAVGGKYRKMKDAPPEIVREYFRRLDAYHALEAEARRLGWQEMSEKMEREHQEVIERARKR